MPKLTLIDGSSYLFRAYHALPPLSNAAGEPTGALYGVISMLRAILAAPPDYIAFVCDAPGPTFRHEMAADYKANRPPMPDDLRAQVQPMLTMVEALGLPLLCVEGVEADDVIGTLTRQAVAKGIEVEISTSDKDFAQMVGPGVALVNTMTRTRMDEAGVVAKFGVRPEQIIDFLALTGDKIDNVRGVDKCGPKTAAKWLGQYETLDALMTNAHAIGGKIGENLRAALDYLPLSRELVTIKTDVALEVAPEALKLREPAREQLRELYTRYGFSTELKRLDGNAPAPAPRPAATPAAPMPAPPPILAPQAGHANAGHYEQVLTPAQLQDWLARLRRAELIAFDTAADTADPMLGQLVGLAFAVEAGSACYIPLRHDYPGAPRQLDRESVLDALRPLLEDETRPKLSQRAKFNINVLARHGVAVRGVRHDTMLESYVLNPTGSRHELDALAERHLGYQTVALADVAGKGAKQLGFNQVDLDSATRYAAEQADITLRLHQALWPTLGEQPGLRTLYSELELPLLPVLARIERRGVLVDAGALQQQSADLGARMLQLRAEAFELAGHEFNLDSPKQLQAVLFDELGLPAAVKTPKGQPSTNEEALAAIADQHALPQRLLDYRACAKLRSTYTDKLPLMINPATGRVHTCYHQAVAATGRLSSSDPNLQNIPVRSADGRRIRQAFVAPPGWLVMAADYSQIELRIMAHLSGDAGLLGAFNSGIDIHRATAAEVLGIAPDAVDANQRRAAKAVNFGLMYGMSAFGLARNLGISRGEASDYIGRYFSRYPGVRAFMDATREQARDNGYVDTLFGRRLYLPELASRNGARRAGAERAAINAPMQGSAADIIKRAMLAVDAWLADRHDAHMLMQVHDELVFEVREEAVEAIREGVRQRMVAAAELAVPLVVDIGVGANWDVAH
ncbi:MAG TPA: DNA polymerase I [Rhodanobacteraceae bacterium]|nr:DNA polymerase I [Rhodanobacteraceae bacterium]